MKNVLPSVMDDNCRRCHVDDPVSRGVCCIAWLIVTILNDIEQCLEWFYDCTPGELETLDDK